MVDTWVVFDYLIMVEGLVLDKLLLARERGRADQ